MSLADILIVLFVIVAAIVIVRGNKGE